MIKYTDGISAEEYMELRRLVGWMEFPLEEAENCVKNAYMVLAVRDENDRAIGVVRLLWDGGYVAFLSDVIVVPEYQGQGIGRTLVNAVIKRIKADMKPGFKVKLNLNAAKGKEPFYEKFGFKIRPNDDCGAGMNQWLTFEETMNNPWEDISLDDYEKHMSLNSVKQLQVMNAIMKDQFEAYPVKTAMVLGIAGGNGLEHVSTEKYDKVYGVDINKDYLNVVSERYKNLSGVLECLQIDLINDHEKLPGAQLVIANLLVEYIGYEAFQKAILQIDPEYVSCVIQINSDEKAWVSDSPYIHSFDSLDSVHCQMEENALDKAMKDIGYLKMSSQTFGLPNGKAFIRIDYRK